ncbi:PAS domain S-box-containing protein [Mariprofundus ferrinatatus]|uniref:histidine kinase n=1 Tax=Mariprofundus ferrinatatus TaxID=1921087 RepID=A0A2K8L5M8_9PROT|nr:ABC transporter substrate-binding protein [Mariprofundus ferrinatatus]ATX82618.1 PAS domain S-box-containing protein [Mariprofundus ferrinatatus]
MGMVKTLHPIRSLFALFSLIFLGASSTGAAEQIELQLKWRHAFQFAGFYMAIEKGYYRDEGLNVKLLEGGPGNNPIEHVLKGEGRYGITDTGVLMARSAGKPVKTLAAFFQHSPLALAVLADSGIHTFAELKGRRAMMQSGHMDAVILAAMKKAGLGPGDIIRQDTSFNLQDLINHNTDAFSVYTTDQPHQLDEMGIPHRLLDPRDLDIDFYGDILVTSEAEVAKHPKRVDAMIRASMNGWRYALDHMDEAIELIIQKYNSQSLSRHQLYHEAVKTSELILKDVVALGYMSEERWQKIAATYRGLGLIPADFQLDGMLYEPETDLKTIIRHYAWQLTVFALLALLAIFALQTVLLRRMVKARTEALKRSESHFRTLVENVPGVTYRCACDECWTMDYINDSIALLSGYPASDFLGNRVRSFASIIHPDDTESVSAQVIQAVKGGNHYNLEYRIICRDGAVRWVHERGKPVYSQNGSVAWLEGNIFDISEKKQTEQLMQSTTRILEMIVGDKKLLHILEEIVNSYEAIYPNMKASILRLRDGKLYTGAAPSLPDAYTQAVEGLEIGESVGSCGTAAFLKKRVIVDDIEHDPLWAPYVELALSHHLRACWSEPVFDSKGEVLGTFAMYYDHPASPSKSEIEAITNAAKLCALAIERSIDMERLQKLSSAIEQASEVVTITNRDGKIEYVNPAFTRITGFSSEEALGKTPGLFRADGYVDQIDEIREVIHQGNIWQGKIIEKKKDGSTYPAMLTLSPIRDGDGTITHFVGVHEDISKIQALEEQFYQAQKMESIGTLVGGIAHDFNNMLAGITGNVYLIGKATEGQPKVAEKLENVQKLIGRAAEMIKQLLTFAKKDVVQKRTVLLTPFLNETYKLHKVSIPEDVDLTLEISENMKVSADITQLQQVLLNLMNNARDAVEDVKQPVIHIRLNRFLPDSAFLAQHESAKNIPYAHLTIKDNGYGIAEEHLSSIFDPFFTTKGVGKGTGLGLSMVFGAIHSHGGIIEVKSKVGRGTTFHIYLPIIKADPEEHSATETLSRSSAGETILLVDDEPSVLEVIGEVLEQLGYRVEKAENGIEALDLFNSKQGGIDLILTDVVMPKMGGLELAGRLRKQDAFIPIIFATGYDKRQEIERDNRLQGTVILNKPYSVELLDHTLATMLDRKGPL